MRRSSCFAAAAAALLLTQNRSVHAQAGKPVASPNDAAAAKPPGKLTKPPKLLHFVEAPYPASELPPQKPNPGPVSVLLAVGIGADGKIVDASVVETGGSAFDEAAIAAVKAFEFSPAEIDGVPTAVRIQYRYEFTPPQKATVVKTTADFEGIVRDRKTGQPIAGVTVQFDELSTTTDAAGHFSFPNAAVGAHSVTLSGSNFTPVGTEETLVAGQRYSATYDVEVETEAIPPEERADFELVIIDTVFGKAISVTSVSADQGARAAGTGGDVIKVVENLPGVARSTVGSGQLVVWGAGAGDTRVYVDDVHIPVLYHEGGFRSVIHSDLVRTVELEPGGYGAPYGRGLGGLVTVGLRPLEADGYHGSLAVDAIDAAASLRGSIGEHIRFAGAVRRSHLDTVLSNVSSEDVGAFVPIPKYWDSQLRVAWVPREGESLEVGGLLSSDSISRSLVEADPSENKKERKTTGFERVYFRYQRQFDDGSTVTATPYIGFDRTNVSSQFGAVPSVLKNDATLFGLRTSWSGRAADFVTITAGLDTEVQRTSVSRQGSVTSPPREGDVRVFGQTPSDQVNGDQWKTTIAGLAPFTQADFSFANNTVHIIPGARLEPSLYGTNKKLRVVGDFPPVGVTREDTHIEPRLAMKWAATSRITLRGAVGIYHQAPVPEDLSAVFGNPNLGPSRAMHYVLGTSFKLSKPITAEITGFYAKQDHLVTRSPLPSPVDGQALIQDGKGRAYGTQFLIRHDITKGFFGWVSYSILRSERTDGGSTQYRPFDFDQTHVFTALASYDLGAGFEIGARFRYSTGYPRTPVTSATYDSRLDSYSPNFGMHNSIRIPAFYQVDGRFAKRFKLGETSVLEAYLDVQNVTDHRNPEEIVYNFDYTKRSYITGLPILPVIGGKLSW